jgi:hypothetical protein
MLRNKRITFLEFVIVEDLINILCTNYKYKS